MKRKINAAQILVFGFIFVFCFAAARAQIVPRACFETKPETFTRTLTHHITAGNPNDSIQINEVLPSGFYKVTLNPGNSTEETYPVTYVLSGNDNLRLPAATVYSHAVGEPVLISTDGEAVFGYKNPGSSTVVIPRGVSSGNYFFPGQLVYAAQPTSFLPGVKEGALRMKLVSGVNLNWFLNGTLATVAAVAEQGCGIITYQGRLSDAGAAANGNYDLEFKIFDAPTGGNLLTQTTIEDVAVTNGIFTVGLNVGASLNNNYAAKFLEIGARAGASTDAFSTLTPRQPLTPVPNAINAVNAVNAANAQTLNNIPANQYVLTTNSTNFIQNSTARQTANFNVSGSGTIGGNLNVGGTLNANYGQSVETVLGSKALLVDAALTNYTLVPGLTQTINVPANSSLLISTEGGIQSNGAVGTASVVDAAIFVDGVLLKANRIVILNNPFPLSVNNWVLSHGLTPSAGSHTIEVRVRTGGVGAADANASSNSDPLLRGQLTVAVIRK